MLKNTVQSLLVLFAVVSCGGATTSTSSTGNGGSTTGAGGSSVTTTGTGGTSSTTACGKTTCVDGQVCCDASCGICGSPDGACPQIACIDPPVMNDSCNAVAPAPTIISCVQAFGAPPTDVFGQPVDITVHGAVLNELDGILEGGCLEPLVRNLSDGSVVAGQAKTLTVSDGLNSWDVEYAITGTKLPTLKGAMVDVSYHYQFGGFGPTQRRLSVASGSGTAIYLAEGGELKDLVGLPVNLLRGTAVCSVNEMCGGYSRYDITATAGALTATVRHSSTASVGDYLVVHGGYEEQTSTNSMCADWFVADVHVGVIRRSSPSGGL